MQNLEEVLRGRFSATEEATNAFFREAAPAVAACGLAMARAFHRGGRLLVFGAGAAATDALHEAVEFVHPVIAGWRALPALALPYDVATFSGVTRRSGEAAAFAHGLRALARPGDIAMGISADGDCPHVLEALAAARELGLLTVAVVGGSGGEVARRQAADHVFVVPGEDPTVVQEVQETLYHVFFEVVHTFFQHPSLVREGA